MLRMECLSRQVLVWVVVASILSACTPSPQSDRQGPAVEAKPQHIHTSPFQAVALLIGNEAAVDRSVKPRTRFGVGDTIIASISTRGTSDAVKLRARLVYQDGQTYGDIEQTISPTGPQLTNFEFTRTSPWRLGHYQVEAFVDDARVLSQPIRVVENPPASR